MSNETSSFKQVWPLIINEIKHTLEDISSNDIQILVQNLIKAKNIFVTPQTLQKVVTPPANATIKLEVCIKCSLISYPCHIQVITKRIS